MTTRTFSSVVDHTSDAGFRAWAAEVIAEFVACGLVQTADTGQINTATVTRPGTNTAGGYAIFRLADSSLYLKIEFGTAASGAAPQMWITVGTGSNGAGTITGSAMSTRTIVTAGAAATSVVTAYTSYLCVVPDAVSFSWKNGSAGAGTRPLGAFAFGWPLDSSGVRITAGFGVWAGSLSSSVNLQSVRVAPTAVASTPSPAYSLVVGAVTSSLKQNGDRQVYPWFLNLPECVPWIWGCTYLTAEVTRLNTFETTLYGPLSHHYLAFDRISSSPSGGVDASGSVAYAPGLIYE